MLTPVKKKLSVAVTIGYCKPDCVFLSQLRYFMMPGQMIGVFCTLSAVAFGLVAGVIIKVLSDDLSLLTTLFYRFLFCLPLILGVALWAEV